jgi:hypothetical protein
MEGRMMVMRHRQEHVHRAITLTQALMIVNGKSAQITPGIWPWSLVDLLGISAF